MGFCRIYSLNMLKILYIARKYEFILRMCFNSFFFAEAGTGNNLGV